MKAQSLIAPLLIIAAAISLKAQTTSLITYNGGFFVKNDTLWEEHRPNDKATIWSTYTQTHENDNFYYAENNKCKVALPKNKANHIYIKRNGQWKIVYNTKEVYGYCPEAGRLFYCYTGGYFVRDNNIWREYRPQKKYDLWASYTQIEEQEHFFIIENTNNKVAIPKKSQNSIFIMHDGQWIECYQRTTIYDPSSTHQFNFYFTKYTTDDKQEQEQEQSNNGSARLSFDRRGNLQICYGNKHHNLKFDNIYTLRHKENDTPIGIELTIDKNKKIRLIGNELCAIDIAGVCPYINFIDGRSNSDLNYIIELIQNRYYFLRK